MAGQWLGEDDLMAITRDEGKRAPPTEELPEPEVAEPTQQRA